VREWTDTQTGRAVRQLTAWPAGATVAPFRRPKHLPDGRILGHQGGPDGGYIAIAPDSRLLCGEGTDGHSFVHAAAFCMQDSRIQFVPLATIHTPYRPFSVGQHVNAGFSADNRWLLYNDTIEEKLQVCAVPVDL